MYQDDFERASVAQVSVRRERADSTIPPPERNSSFQKVWHISDKLTRNFLCIALVVICVYAVQSAHFPDGATVTTAIQSIVDENWDENLGRIQFVSNMFPETLSVFWNGTDEPTLQAPSNSRILHAWNQDEPYLSLSIQNGAVTALADGIVRAISRDNNGHFTVAVSLENSYETVYHDLISCQVSEGTNVRAGEVIGKAVHDEEMVFELRQEGLPLDPTGQLNLTGGAF